MLFRWLVVRRFLTLVLGKMCGSCHARLKRAECALRHAQVERVLQRDLDRIDPAPLLPTLPASDDMAVACGPKAVSQLLTKAEAIAGNRLDVFGATALPWLTGGWHSDFQAGYTWDRAFFAEFSALVPQPDGRDKRVPWELSRFQHLFLLARASAISGNRQLRDTVDAAVRDWVQANPVGYGINWTNAMEVSIRAMNLLLTASALRDQGGLSGIDLTRVLLQHGTFILDNLEFSIDRRLQKARRRPGLHIFRANHYLFGVAGLCVIAASCRPDGWFGRRTDEFIALLVREVEFQTLEDGVNFEGSIAYHGLVTECLLVTAILLDRAGRALPQAFFDRLDRMLDFVRHYTTPDGGFPNIGDDDGGSVFAFTSERKRSHVSLLTLAAAFLNKPAYRLPDVTYGEEALWLLGPEGRAAFESLSPASTPPPSKAFEAGGVYVLRDRDCHMAVSAGDSIRHGTGGHVHNDVLSFTLHAGGTSFIVDPGSGTYAARDVRNLFRASRSHNTIVIDRAEINRFDPRRMFYMEDDARPRVLRWQTSPASDVLEVEHAGYHRLAHPVSVRRQIRFEKADRFWEVTDSVRGTGVHDAHWYFHFAPMPLHQAGLRVTTGGERAVLELDVVSAPPPLHCVIEAGRLAPEYGVQVEAPVVSYRVQHDLSASDLDVTFALRVVA